MISKAEDAPVDLGESGPEFTLSDANVALLATWLVETVKSATLELEDPDAEPEPEAALCEAVVA